MRFIVLILMTVGLLNLASGATLYRWVDEQGRVHYSDRPQDGADKIEIQPAPRTSPPPAQQPVRRPQQSTAPAAQPPAAKTYESVSVVNPGEDQVLWNIGAVLTVSIAAAPRLHDGHRVVVRFNGEVVEGWPPQALNHQVNDVFRGTHTVSAAITDENGSVLITSAPVTFHVKQTSILN